jgi:hypothetical protein
LVEEGFDLRAEQGVTEAAIEAAVGVAILSAEL